MKVQARGGGTDAGAGGDQHLAHLDLLQLPLVTVPAEAGAAHLALAQYRDGNTTHADGSFHREPLLGEELPSSCQSPVVQIRSPR